eukprot:gene13181-15574_t
MADAVPSSEGLDLSALAWEGEETALIDLKKMLEDKKIDFTAATYGFGGQEIYLRKFLRARQLDPVKALLMIENNVKWREENKVDTCWDRLLENEKRETIAKLYWAYYCGHDRMGNWIYLEHTAAINFEGLFATCELPDLLHAHIQLQEYQTKVRYGIASARKSEVRARTTNIMDMRGLSMSMLTSTIKDLISKISTVNQDNYPEGLYQCFIVNAPWAFTMIYAFVKPFLNEHTQNKVKVLGYGEAMWEELKEALGPDSLVTAEHVLGDDPVKGPWKDLQTVHSMCQ